MDVMYICRMCGNRLLRRIFGTKRKEITGGLRKLHTEFHNFSSSPNIVMVIKSRRMI
jgi:hypothetical protein